MEPASSELFVQAVDAGTSGALRDGQVTVRYLVRTPITLDAAAVERVASAEPYRIVHSVASDSLVVELRLEAPSYDPIDTVLAVVRGGSGGTTRIGMTPRTGRVAAAATAPAVSPATAGPTRPAAPPAAAAASPTAADDPADLTVDLSGFRDGDVAFQSQDWRRAIAGYSRMVPPRGRGPYARQYELALVRLGISQINLGVWQGAKDALSDAVALNLGDYTAYFYLGQVECELGNIEPGRRALGEVGKLAPAISIGQRPIALALTDYQMAVCSHREYRMARTSGDQQRTAARAVADLEAFVERSGAMTPIPPQVQGAVADARKRLTEITRR